MAMGFDPIRIYPHVGSNPTSGAKGENNMDTKICTKCGRELPLNCYYSRGNGKLRSDCKDCHNGYVKDRYSERKSYVSKIKESKGCMKCGDKRKYVLDFHHLNPQEKDETIARMTSNKNNLSDIEKEIEKCCVLCANCHREFHYLESSKGITIEEYLSS